MLYLLFFEISELVKIVPPFYYNHLSAPHITLFLHCRSLKIDFIITNCFVLCSSPSSIVSTTTICRFKDVLLAPFLVPAARQSRPLIGYETTGTFSHFPAFFRYVKAQAAMSPADLLMNKLFDFSAFSPLDRGPPQ